jgi:hypothetical protein
MQEIRQHTSDSFNVVQIMQSANQVPLPNQIEVVNPDFEDEEEEVIHAQDEGSSKSIAIIERSPVLVNDEGQQVAMEQKKIIKLEHNCCDKFIARFALLAIMGFLMLFEAALYIRE